MHLGVGMHGETTDLEIKALNQAETRHQVTEKQLQVKRLC